MLVPAFNASHGAIVTLPRAVLLAVAAALVAASVAAFGPEADRRMADANRPTLVRRLDALPPIVVSTPPYRPATTEDAGR